MTLPATAERRKSPRRRAERAVAQLHQAEVEEIEAEIEAGRAAADILRARQHPAAGLDAVRALARLRSMVIERLDRLADGYEPWPGPLLTPYEVDLGQVNMWLYLWAAVLLGVTLAQNAVDGNPDAPGRPIPGEFTLRDTRLPEFWHGDADDDQEPPEPIGDWPLVVTSGQACARTGAA